MNDKQQEAIKKLEQLGKVVASNKVRSMVFVDLVVVDSPAKKHFDTWKIYRNGKAVLVG